MDEAVRLENRDCKSGTDSLSHGTLREGRRYGRKAIPVYDNHFMHDNAIGVYITDLLSHVLGKINEADVDL